MVRLYDEIEDINSDKVKDFFNNRATKDVESDLSIVLFQDKENSERRNREENQLVLEKIDFVLVDKFEDIYNEIRGNKDGSKRISKKSRSDK